MIREVSKTTARNIFSASGVSPPWAYPILLDSRTGIAYIERVEMPTLIESVLFLVIILWRGANMRKSAALVFLLLALSAVPAFAVPADTLTVADVSRDTVDETPKGWENVLPPKGRLYTNYLVRYDGEGPYIHAASNGAGSWIERDLGQVDPSRYPVLEWEWKTISFPAVEWERNDKQDDFTIRLELVYDYSGGKWNPLNIMRKGLITSFFRGNPPAAVLSYVWSAEVPVDEPYPSPATSRVTVVPIESGVYMTGRWMHEKRDILADIKRFLPGERNLTLKKIRIRCDTDDSGSTAQSGIRNIRLIGAPESE